MDDQPRNVKDLLVELKDASELMVDLAYAAVFFNEEKLAQEVERLEQRMSGHLHRLRITAMLAARSQEDAEGMAAVLWIAHAIEQRATGQLIRPRAVMWGRYRRACQTERRGTDPRAYSSPGGLMRMPSDTRAH